VADHTTVNKALYLNSPLVERHIYSVWEVYCFGVSWFSKKNPKPYNKKAFGNI